MGYTVPQMKEALYKAHKAGNQDHAALIAATIKREIERQKTDEGAKWELQQGIQPIAPETMMQQQEQPPSLLDRAAGAGEAGLTALSGATTGFLSGIGRTIGQAGREIASGEFGSNEAAQRIQQASEQGMQSGTYMPRTEQGRQNVEALGEATESLGALPPVLSEAQMISSAVRQATGYAPVATQRATQVADRLNQSIAPVAEKARSLVGRGDNQAGKNLSVGAAQNPKALVRKSEAEGLLVPVKLTQGEADRENFDLRRFEEETAKTEAGAPFRERRAESNARLSQNFDAMIDELGSVNSMDLGAIGDVNVSVLRNQSAKSKKAIRAQYKKAEASGGLKANVNLSPLANYLNENRAARGENSIMGKVQRQLDVLGISEGDFTEGNLKIGKPKGQKNELMGARGENRDITINQAEAVRRFINKYVNDSDPNDLRIASELKQIIDSSTENVGNTSWKLAHKMRREHAQKFENVSLIKNLIGSKKGTEERVVALEDVLNKSVLGAGAKRENLAHLKKLLNDAGDEGKEAWRELQGGTLNYLREKSLNKNTDTQGNQYFSHAGLVNALKSLKSSGKLDVLLDAKQRQNLDLLEQVSSYVMTAPSGVINSSNTATVLSFIADMALLGTTGVPVPVVSASKAFAQHIKDKKLKYKINKSLGLEENK